MPKLICFDDLSKHDLEVAQARAWQYTNCIFRTHRFTNYAGLELPISATVEFFTKGRAQTERRGLLTIEVDAMLDQDRIPLPDFTPLIPNGAYVSDMRHIAQATPFGVVVFSGTNWPKPEDTKKISGLIAHAKQARGRTVVPTTRKQRVTRSILLLVALAPILFFGCWLIAKQKNKQNKKTNESST